MTTYFWDFGDGQTSTEQNPSHVYENFGVYTVSLSITDDLGNTTTTVKPDYIEAIEVPTNPFNYCYVNPNTGAFPETSPEFAYYENDYVIQNDIDGNGPYFFSTGFAMHSTFFENSPTLSKNYLEMGVRGRAGQTYFVPNYTLYDQSATGWGLGLQPDYAGSYTMGITQWQNASGSTIRYSDPFPEAWVSQMNNYYFVDNGVTCEFFVSGNPMGVRESILPHPQMGPLYQVRLSSANREKIYYFSAFGSE